MNHLLRLSLFFSLVWRPCTHPDAGWTLRRRLQSLIDPRTAWEAAGIIVYGAPNKP